MAANPWASGVNGWSIEGAEAPDWSAGINGWAVEEEPTQLQKDFAPDRDFLSPKERDPGNLLSALEGRSTGEANAAIRREQGVREIAAADPVNVADDRLTIAGKWVENLDDRAKTWVGGLLQSVPALGAEALGGAAMAVGGIPLGQAVSNLVAKPLERLADPVTQTGKDISTAARAELEANAPNFGDDGQNTIERYAYDIANGFVDMGASLAVAAVTRSPTAGASLMGAQVFGEQFDDSIRRGRTGKDALADAGFMGIAELISERIPLKILMEPGGAFLKRAAKSAAAEGLQEIVTEVLQTGYDVGVLKEDMTWGQAVRQVIDAGIIGSAVGGGLAVTTEPFMRREGEAPPTDDQLGRAAEPMPPVPGRSYGVADAIAELGMDAVQAERFVATGVDPRTEPEKPLGLREAGSLSPDITPEDEASPLPTDKIIRGKMTMGAAEATPQANLVLRGLGMPDVGSRVEVERNGEVRSGAIADAYTVDIAGQTSQGVKIRLDDGTMIEEPVETLRDLGVTVRPETISGQPKSISGQSELISGLPEGDMADPVVRGFVEKGLAAAAQSPLGAWFAEREGGTVPAEVAVPSRAEIAPQARPDPVGNGKAIIEGLFPDARVTSSYRGPDHPLSKKNPSSWHAKSHAAVDVAPIPGMTFEQAKARIQQSGYTLIEAINETGSGKTKHATGDHWHFVLGGKGVDAAGAGVQGDMLGGPELTGSQIDAKRAADAVPEDDADDAIDHAHEVLSAPDAEYEAHNGRNLGATLGVEIAPEEAADYARAVLERFGNREHGRAVGGAETDEGDRYFHDGTGTLGIPRREMPQIKAEHRGAMVNFLNARGIAHEEVTVPAHRLKPGQAEFTPEKVQRAKEFTGGDRAILIDRDGYVVDGHHQWIADLDRGRTVRAIQLDAPLKNIAKALEDMPSAETAGIAKSPQATTAPVDTESGTDVPEQVSEPSAEAVTDKPLAAEGLTSFRYQNGKYAPVMIGATDEADALRQAERSIDGTATSNNLEVWDGSQYVPVAAPAPLSKQDAMKAKMQAKAAGRAALPANDRRSRKPMSVIAFVRSIGGIKDNEGHDLSKGRGLRRHPGLINNKRGLSVDAVGEALWEAGYIGTPDRRPAEADVLELLDEADRRPTYRPSEAIDADDAEQRDVSDAQEAEARDEISSIAAEFDLPLNDDEIETALYHMASSGVSAATAIERAIMQANALDQFEVDLESRASYDYADVADRIFSGPEAEARGGLAEGLDGPIDTEGDAGPGEARSRPDAEAGADARVEDAGRGDSEQLDAFGPRTGDERRALERQAEGRQRSDKKQKAPGEDGGLFDTRDTTGDMLDPPAPSDAASDEARAPRDGMVALFDDEDTAAQVGWFDPETGAVERLSDERRRAQVGEAQSSSALRGGIDQAQVGRFREALIARMKELGLDDRITLEVGVRLKSMADPTWQAQYDPLFRIISIALEQSKDPWHSLNHEAIHALRDLKVFTPAEWQALVDAAWADRRLSAWAKRNYPDLTLELQKEEAAAEYAAEAFDLLSGRADRGKPMGRTQSMLARTFARVVSLFRAIQHGLARLRTGQPDGVTAFDVLKKINDGTLGRRRTASPTVRGRAVAVTWSQAQRDASTVEPSRRASTLTEAEDAARAFVGKRLPNAMIGVAATVSKKSLKKMVSASAVQKSDSASDHALAVANLDQLYPAAREISRNPDERGAPSIKSIIRASADMTTPDGRLVEVRILVKEMASANEANPLYTLEVEEVGTRIGAGFTASTHRRGRNVAPTGPDVDIIDGSGDAKSTDGTKAQVSVKPMQSKLVARSASFKRWFGDSKVVDENDNPLIMYHGTSKDQGGDAFTMFDTYASNYGLMGMGSYFTADPDIASSYTNKGRGTSPTVYAAYLSIKNPLDMDAPADVDAWQRQFEGIEDFHEGGSTNENWYRAAEEALIADELPMYEGAEAMQDGLRAMGFDGITHLGGGRVDSASKRHRVFVAFDPEQIKSATGNSGAFDPANPDIRAQVADAPGARIPSPMGRTFEDPEFAEQRLWAPVRTILDVAGPSGTSDRVGEAIDSWRTTLQDKMLPVMRMQARIERMLGRPLADSENPYLGEEIMTGRIGAQLDDLTEQHIEPLFDAMREEKVSPDELQTFLYARHAPERNARIASINSEFPDGGSGMRNDEAASIMAEVDRSGKREALDRLAERVDALNDLSVRTRVESGLLSEEEAKAWRANYRFYVPLRGLNDEGDSAGGSDRVRRQSGVSVKGAESKRAFGRKSRASDILPYVMLQAEEAIIRAEQNQVARSFLELARTAPDKDFWAVDKVRRVPVFNKASGQVSYRSESRIAAEDAPFTVSAKVEGVEHRVTLNRDNPAAVDVAAAMRNLDAQKFGWVVGVMGKLNRFLSAVNTSFNPEFVVTNAIRDIEAGSINLASRDIKGIVAGTLKDYRKALTAALKGEFGRDGKGGEWAKWYREFKLAGGRTYYNDVQDLDQLRAKVERGFEKAKSPLSIRAALGGLKDFIENANGGVENALRLASFKNAREAGLSPRQAASIARNVTVNFTRKGSAGPVVNAAYLFFNASMQGSATTLRALKSRKVQGIALSLVMLGFMQDWLNDLLGDDDEDGQSLWDKLPEFQKSRNLIFFVPGRPKPLKIPMAYGYSIFPNMGRMIGEIMRGKKPLDSVGHWIASTIDSFNPVGGGGNVLNWIAPTIVDPLVDLFATNKDFAGRPIVPEQNQFAPDVPDAQRYWPTVQKHWRALTDFLTAATGGDDVRPGSIDISPETLEYMQGQVLGAAGATAGRAVDMINKGISGEKIETESIPFARQVVGGKPAWYDRSLFYARIGDVEQQVDYAKKYKKSGDIEGLRELQAERGDVLALSKKAKAAQKIMRAIRKEKRELALKLDQGAIGSADHDSAVNLLETKEQTVISRFNAIYFANVSEPIGAD